MLNCPFSDVMWGMALPVGEGEREGRGEEAREEEGEK
jgi:hypothetical protein